MDVPDYPFDEQYDSFAFNSLLTRDEAIQAVGKVRTECNKVSGMSLFHVPTTKHMKLEEFEQAQAQATSQVGPQGTFQSKQYPLISGKHVNLIISYWHHCLCIHQVAVFVL